MPRRGQYSRAADSGEQSTAMPAYLIVETNVPGHNMTSPRVPAAAGETLLGVTS